MSQQPQSGSVILLHGLWAHPMMMTALAGAGRRHGFATLNPMYRSRAHALDRIVDGLHPRIAAFLDRTPGPVHFVTHSMGSLVARAYIARHRPERLGRVVMLAPPNRGSVWVDLARRLHVAPLFLGPSAALLAPVRTEALTAALGAVDYPLGIIAGSRSLPFVTSRLMLEPNDGKVAVSSTHLAGQSDHMVVPTGHTAITRNREVIRQTFVFLDQGRFDRGG